MKVKNWRRKLAATLVATGLLPAAAAQAANLDTNLVTNPGFESVNPASTGDYGAPQINNWTGIGYAYSHNPGVTGIPDYADGADPPNAGDWYFTANNQPLAATDIRDPDVFYQDMPVNAGPSGTQIAAGEAAARFSAWMSSYDTDPDYGTVHLQFKNASGTTLGTARIDDPDAGADNVWNQTSSVAFIPAGTTSIRVSLFGFSFFEGRGGDGYIDNVDVQVTDAANVLAFAEVNTVTGQVSIKNTTGQSPNVDYYEITSASGSLNRAGWTSLQDQNLPFAPAGNGSGNGWEEGGGGGNGAISESFLRGSTTVPTGATIPIGAAFNPAGTRDLAFKYGLVLPQVLSADFDSDGDVDGRDFLTWQRGLSKPGAAKADGDADGDMDVDAADLGILRSQLGTSAFGGPSILVQGFVRYVTPAAAAVPEPGSIVVIGAGLAALAGVRRRSENHEQEQQ
jgi:hypothetical protein